MLLLYPLIIFSIVISCVHSIKKDHSTISYEIIHHDTFWRLTNMCIYTNLSYKADYNTPFYNRYEITPSNWRETFFSEKTNTSYYVKEFWKMPIVPIHKAPKSTLIEISGMTMLPECFYQGTNPAHYIFGLSSLFEMAINLQNEYQNFQFDNLAMLRCSVPFDFPKWEWGKIVFSSVVSELVKGRLIQDDNHKRLIMSDRRTPKLFCFENLIVPQRWDHFFSSLPYYNLFHKNLKNHMLDYLSLRKNLTTFNQQRLELIHHENIRKRCEEKKLNIYFQHRASCDNGLALRTISNINSMVDLARNYSSSVKRFTIGSKTSMIDQYIYYNSFDILVSPVGSQLSNLLLTERKNVAVIEIGVANREPLWYDANNQLWNFKSYIVSNKGHTPLCKEKLAMFNQYCKPDPQLGEDAISCTAPNGTYKYNVAWEITDCSFEVNLIFFQKQLKDSIRRLCKAHY